MEAKTEKSETTSSPLNLHYHHQDAISIHRLLLRTMAEKKGTYLKLGKTPNIPNNQIVTSHSLRL